MAAILGAIETLSKSASLPVSNIFRAALVGGVNILPISEHSSSVAYSSVSEE